VQLARGNNLALQQAANQAASGTITVALRRADFAPDLNLTVTFAERFDFDKAPELGGGSGDGRYYETVSVALSSEENLFSGFGDVAALLGAKWALAGVRDSYQREEQMPLMAYSCRRASIGLSLAARRAGKKPKITPMAAEKAKAITLMPRPNR
jgi:outer membrane protein TolC